MSFPWLPTSNKGLNALFWIAIVMLGIWLMVHLLRLLRLVMWHA